MRRLVSVGLLALLLLAAPAAATSSSRYDVLATGYDEPQGNPHCGDAQGGTCTLSDTNTDNGVRMSCLESDTGSGAAETCRFTAASSQIDIPRAEVSFIRHFINYQYCTDRGPCSTVEFRDCTGSGDGGGICFWDYIAGGDWASGWVPPDSGGDTSQAFNLCTSNAACDNFIQLNASGGPEMRVSYRDRDGAWFQDEDGFLFDYMHWVAVGDVNHPTASTCTGGCTGAWHQTDFTATISCTDAGTSGGASSGCDILYCLDGDGTPDCTPSTSCTAPCGPTITTEDDWYIRWVARDKAGNFQLPSAASDFKPVISTWNAWNDGGIQNWLIHPNVDVANGVCDVAPIIPTADNYARVPGFVEPGTGLTWFAYNPGTPRINLHTATGTPTTLEDEVAYALTYVWSDTSRSVRVWSTSDDGIRVYTNGVQRTPPSDGACQGWGASWENAIVTLNAGWNTILVQVTDNTGSWEFTLDIDDTTDSVGHTYQDVAISQNPGTTTPANLYVATQQSFEGLDKTNPTGSGAWFENPGSPYLFINAGILYFSDGMGATTIRAGISGTASDPAPCCGTQSGLASVTFTPEFGDTPTNNGTLSAWTTGVAASQGYGISNVDSDGTSPAGVTITDVAGRFVTLAFTYIEDITAPTTADDAAAACSYPNWRNSDCSVTLTCSDPLAGKPSSSGCDPARDPLFCVDTAGTCIPGTDYTAPIAFTCPANDVCVRHLRFRATDRVENTETLQNRTIRIDKIPPITSGPRGDQGWFATNRSIALVCTDPIGIDTTDASLCETVQDPLFCVDTADACAPSIDYTGTINIACNDGTSCTRYLRYRSRDNALNVETPLRSARFRIDRFNPSVTIDTPANGTWFRRNFQVTATDFDTDPVNSTGSGLGPAALPASELAGWWKFNECSGTAADSSGNGNTGTLINGATWNTSGRMGCGVGYSPATEANVSVANFGTFNIFGVSAWIYRNGSTSATSDRQSVVSYKEGDGANCGFVLAVNDEFVNPVDSNLQYPIIFVQVNGVWQWAQQTTAIPLNTWTHLAAVYNGTHIFLYRNGALVATTAANGTMTQCTQGVSIGNRAPGNLNHRFPGVIDDVRLYSRAVSADEVSAIYTVTSTYSDDVACYYRVESSPDGSTWTQTQGYLNRTCPSGDPDIGIWSPAAGGPYADGHDCQNSGDPSTNGRCRVTIRAIDNVGNLTQRVGQFRIDWDGPFVNITSPASHSWQTANFAVVGPETDYPPGGVASGLFNCTLRIARIPSAGGAWTLVNWSAYSCTGAPSDPVITVGAGQQCSDQADNATYPRHRATCLVVTGASDIPTIATVSNPSMLYYPLDENDGGTTATDLGPRGINGTLTAGASFTSDGGYFRHGVNFDGIDDYILANLPSDLTGGPLTNFTVEMWVRPDDNTDRGIFHFFDGAPVCAGGCDRIVYVDGDGDLCMRVWSHDPGTCSVSVPDRLVNNDWNHIALRVQNWTTGAPNYNAATLFRNGTSVATLAVANHSEFDWATRLGIGVSADAGSSYFDGVIDEVKVHFRPLNNTEITWAASGAVPGPLATDGEPGGAKHVRIDYTVPTITFEAPPDGTTMFNDFPINISDADPHSGLEICEYRVEQPPGTPVLGWTSRSCNSGPSAVSANITVGFDQNCSLGPDPGVICRVFVRNRNNAGLYSATLSRDYLVILVQPNLRIEAPKNVRLVALYNNSSETCQNTVPNCATWWFRRLKERGFDVVNVSKADINNSTEMLGYNAILNPYGEIFPGEGGGTPDSIISQIANYTRGGGAWLDSGGESFFFPWNGAPGSALHAEALCVNIDAFAASTRTRTREPYGANSLPHSPASYRVEPADVDRPSVGNINICGQDPRFRGLYLNSVGSRWGPAHHCYGAGCVLRTDNTSPPAGDGLSEHVIADIYADTIRHWLGTNWTILLEDDELGDFVFCSYKVRSAGVDTVPNQSRVCDTSINLTVGPGRHCRDEGNDQCRVWVNTSNDTGGITRQLLLGIDWTPPTTSQTISESSPCAYAPNNTWVYYSNSAYCSPPGGSFTILSGASDPGGSAASGVARVEFPDATSGSNITHWPGPHDHVYTFGAASTFSAWRGFKVFDNASNPFPSTRLLEGWWRFSEGSGTQTVESSGNGTNGTISGAGWTTSGRYGNALDFSAASRMVTVANIGSFTNFTASAWVRRTTTSTMAGDIISYKEGDSPNCGFNLSITGNPAYNPRLEVKVGGAWYSAQESFTIPTNQWFLLTGAYDGETVRLYRNGTLVATNAAPSGPMDQCAQSTRIGNRAPGALDRFFPGLIDDVRIWSRNLTHHEINASASNGSTDESGIGVYRVYRDFTVPAPNTGPSYEDRYFTTESVPITLPAVSDTESGIPAGGRLLMRRETALGGGECNAFGNNWTILATDPSSPYTDATVLHANCYQYTYNVTDNVANWANVSTAATARIDITPPSPCYVVSITEFSVYAYAPNNTTIYYNNLVSGGTFNISVLTTDPESNISNVTFPATVSAGTVDTTSPFQNEYTWDGADTYDSPTSATCWNQANNSAAAPFDVWRDIYAPTGNTGPSYTDGFYPVEQVIITLPAVTDNRSGIPSNGRLLMRRQTALGNAVCNAFGNNWTAIAFDPASPYTDNGTAHGNCFQYSYNVTDNVVNWNNTSSASIARIDTTNPIGGFIDYPDGVFAIPADITFDNGTDPESGIAGNMLTRRSALFDPCTGTGPFGPWLDRQSNASSPFTDADLTAQTSYQWRLVVTNRAGNSSEYASINVYTFEAELDPNTTKQIFLYEWQATYTGVPLDRWAFHNSSPGIPDGFTVTQDGSEIRVAMPGRPVLAVPAPAGAGQTHTYKMVYDFACGSGNRTYVYRNGTYLGVTAPGSALPTGDSVGHLISTNTQIAWFIAAPGRWDPPLSILSAVTGAPGCTNYVLDSCQISGARPCTNDLTVHSVSVNATVQRPGAWFKASAVFNCTSSSVDRSLSYNAMNGTGWQSFTFTENTCSPNPIDVNITNPGQPGVNRARASIRDQAEGSGGFTCGTWDADNEDVAFWVAEPVRG